MANLIYAPSRWSASSSGYALSFVVPSEGGCNLSCSFCLVKQRMETSRSSLSFQDYARFIHDFERNIKGVSIQGYEALLPQSMRYTQAILLEAQKRNIASSLVTNGIFLEKSLPELCKLEIRKIGVSLDAAASERHDRIRGVQGAWHQTVRALKHAVSKTASLPTRIEVISVMLPRRVRYLRDMPRLLRDTGVKSWILNPLMRIGGRRPGNFVDSISRIFADVDELQHLAVSHGIRLAVDDDLGLLRELSQKSNLSAPSCLRSLPAGIVPVRLAPGGHCSVGRDIANPVTPDSPRWLPGSICATDFIRSLTESRHDIAMAA